MSIVGSEFLGAFFSQGGRHVASSAYRNHGKLSPIAVSDTVPKFDIVRECRFEGGSMMHRDELPPPQRQARLSLPNAAVLSRTRVDTRVCMGAWRVRFGVTSGKALVRSDKRLVKTYPICG